MTTTLSTGWSKTFRSPIFTLAEAQSCVSTILVRDVRSVSKICDVRFVGSSYPTLAFYTGAPYVSGYGTDRYWAVVTGWRNIILNTSGRMTSRWLELWKTQAERIAVLVGLYMHESYHIIPRHTSDQSGSWPITVAMEKTFVKRYGKPHKPRLKIEEEVAESKLAASEELDAPLSLWQQIKQLIVPEKQIVVPDRDDMTAEEFRWMIGMQ